MCLSFGLDQRLHSEESKPTDLTVNDLAEVLGVHWCIVQLPKDIGANDTIVIEIVSSTGQETVSNSSSFASNRGDKIKFLFWEDEASKYEHMMATWLNGDPGVHSSAGDMTKFTDYVPDSGGPSNGTIMKVGDILFTFSKGKKGSYSPQLKPDQIGYKVVIVRGDKK